jgi:hypothetical protein
MGGSLGGLPSTAKPGGYGRVGARVHSLSMAVAR